MPVRTIIIQIMLPINKHPRHLLASRLRHPPPGALFALCRAAGATTHTLADKREKTLCFYLRQHIKDLWAAAGIRIDLPMYGFSRFQMKSLYVYRLSIYTFFIWQADHCYFYIVIQYILARSREKQISTKEEESDKHLSQITVSVNMSNEKLRPSAANCLINFGLTASCCVCELINIRWKERKEDAHACAGDFNVRNLHCVIIFN